MQAFLAQKNVDHEYALADTTRANYEKEMLRFVLFMKEHQTTCLKEINQSLAEKYMAWVKAPPKALISKDGAKLSRQNIEWKPFSQVPSRSSRNYSFRVMKSLFTWLTKVGVIDRNPFAHLKESKLKAKNKAQVLASEDIKVVMLYLESMDKHGQQKEVEQAARWRWLFLSYLYLGLRASELISCTTNSLIQTQINSESVWILHLVGKGSKASELPVPKAFMTELKRYRKAIGKNALPEKNDPQPLIYNKLGTKGISTRQQIYNEYKALMKTVAGSSFVVDIEQEVRMTATSPHSLRHTFVTGLLDTTNDYPLVQAAARHSDFKTTMGYDKTHLLHMAKVIDTFANETEALLSDNNQ